MSAWIKRLAIAGIGLLAVIQVYRPSRKNPPLDPKNEIAAHVAVNPAAGAVLERSCNDCHSNRTVWPWYSNVAPASWLVVSDVNRGRRALNFSEWGAYPTAKGSKLLEETCKEVTEGEMPPATYTPLHASARLTKADAQEVCGWTASARQSLTGGGAKAE